MKRWLSVAGCLLLAWSALGRERLPVFLADNHAETFGWITRTFDPDDRYMLVLVDAHTDASAAERSEEIREGLRRVPSLAERAKRVEEWRAKGRLQAFNWIEPLLPRPIDGARWLAKPDLAEQEKAAGTAEAVEQLDGRLEVEPRAAASFGGRWETWDLKDYAKWKPGLRPVILAIDLDFFAGMEAGEREKHFATIWEEAMDWPGLAGVAFAVSRPWLHDEQEAEALATLAVDAVRFTRGAELELDIAADERPDDSLRAAELAKEGKSVPRWQAAKTSPALKLKLASLDDRLHVIGQAAAPQEWPENACSIRPASGSQDCDDAWRYRTGEEPVLRVQAPEGSTGRVRWFALEPARKAYDLIPATGLGKGFSSSAGRWIYEKRRSLGETSDFQLDPTAWRKPDGGSFRFMAECETAEGWLPVPPVDLRIRTAEGFRGALSECRGMPYVFGIAGVAGDELSGVETGWGSDCANLLTYAWRRNGVPMTWGDPGRLRAQLHVKVEKAGIADAVPISAAEIETGIAIDFGQHVAALWEDRAPLGLLDGGDLVMHHLGGFPEIVELSALAAERPNFALRVPRRGACKVALAGDVVLAGEDRITIPGFTRGDADLFLANLEGVPSQQEGEKVRFDFRFPRERLAWLREQGIDAVSLANNHAFDAGGAGLLEGITAIHEAGLASCGAGPSKEAACQPLVIERRGTKLALFGISAVGDDRSRDGQAVIAAWPGDKAMLEAGFRAARTRGERIIVMLHAGDEYAADPNEEQRHCMRWLATNGAAVVAGAHPHVTQKEERHGGAQIFYSLGNAVYPRALKGADSGVVRQVLIPP